MYQQYFQNPMQQVVKVNGENGAKAYQMPANSSVLLLDESAPLVWLKTTDGAGYPSLNAYDIKPHVTEKAPDLNDIIERITKLEAKINESNSSGTKRKQSNGTDCGD